MRVPRERQRRKALLVSFFLPTVPVQVTGLGTSDRNFTAIFFANRRISTPVHDAVSVGMFLW